MFGNPLTITIAKIESFKQGLKDGIEINNAKADSIIDEVKKLEDTIDSIFNETAYAKTLLGKI